MSETSACVELTLGKLVYCVPDWEDMEKLTDASDGNPLDVKAALFQLAGRLRGVVVPYSQDGKEWRVYRSAGKIVKQCQERPEQAIKVHLDQVRGSLTKQLNRLDEVESALNELTSEGKL